VRSAESAVRCYRTALITALPALCDRTLSLWFGAKGLDFWVQELGSKILGGGFRGDRHNLRFGLKDVW